MNLKVQYIIWCKVPEKIKYFLKYAYKFFYYNNIVGCDILFFTINAGVINETIHYPKEDDFALELPNL